MLIGIMLSMLMCFMLTGAATAQNVNKPITANYRDVKINVNGTNTNLVPMNEPFIVNGTTFVPVRVIAEALNCYVSWQADTKTVVVTKSDSAELANLKLQVAVKDKEIEDLKSQIEDLKQKNNGLSNLESNLNDDYDQLENVGVDDITLDGDEDQVDVQAEVDLSDYGDEWDGLSDSEIKSWAKSIISDVQDEFSEDTEVTGEITNNDNDDVLVKFSQNGTASMKITYYDDDYRSNSSSSSSDVSDVLDNLDGESFYVGDLEFTVDSIKYFESSDKITVSFAAEDSDASSQWSDMRSSDIDDDVESICQDLADTFDSDADTSLDTVIVTFYDEDSNTLDSFTYDVGNGTL